MLSFRANVAQQSMKSLKYLTYPRSFSMIYGSCVSNRSHDNLKMKVGGLELLISMDPARKARVQPGARRLLVSNLRSFTPGGRPRSGDAGKSKLPAVRPILHVWVERSSIASARSADGGDQSPRRPFTSARVVTQGLGSSARLENPTVLEGIRLSFQHQPLACWN